MPEKEITHEDHFVIFFMQNPMPMWIYDLETLAFLAVNNAAVQRYGYSGKEFLSMTIKDIYPKEDLPKLLKDIPKVAAGLDIACEWRHVTKDESVIHVEITSHVITYKNRRAKLVSAIDITRSRTAEKKLKKNVELLYVSLKDTIRAVAAIVESRTVYTAYHHRRTAELVQAIAAAMDLPEAQAEGAEMAALIHDLGEIAVPAEILNRTGKLNEFEYSIIQTHPQVGYDSLKDINFPWPIAEIILQHHERLDGSGYPHGLKSDEILLEAKIVGVAEMVDAMSSHRPHRAALPIDEILDVISRGKGTLFDSRVVDTCVALFTEKNFKFSLALTG